jgi:hypothetical protein
MHFGKIMDALQFGTEQVLRNGVQGSHAKNYASGDTNMNK